MANDNINVQKAKVNYVFKFTEGEVLALNELYSSTAQLMEITNNIMDRIVQHLTLEESEEILKLRTAILLSYNNYNYHLPSVGEFHKWLHDTAKSCIEDNKF